METVGEAFQLRLRIRLDPLQLLADDACERRAACPSPCRSGAATPDPACSGAAAPRRYPRRSSPGNQPRQHAQRRQFGATADRWRGAFLLPANRSAFLAPPASGRAEQQSCRRSEAPRRGALPTSACIVTGSTPSSRTERPLIWTPSLQHRRHRPARAAELYEQLLRERRARQARPAWRCARRQRSPLRGHKRCGPAG